MVLSFLIGLPSCKAGTCTDTFAAAACHGFWKTCLSAAWGQPCGVTFVVGCVVDFLGTLLCEFS
jgi:hypothetical protein